MKHSAPSRLNPLATSSPQERTVLEVLLPHLRTMLYAIPAESRREGSLDARPAPPARALRSGVRPAVWLVCLGLLCAALGLALQAGSIQMPWRGSSASTDQ